MKWLLVSVLAICGMSTLRYLSNEVSGKDYQQATQYVQEAEGFISPAYVKSVWADGKVSNFEYWNLKGEYHRCLQWKGRHQFKTCVEGLR